MGKVDIHVVHDIGMHAVQTRSEVLAAALASLCIASPTIEARLKELEPGRGRQATPQQVQGATSIFAILDDVTEDQKQVHVVQLCFTAFAKAFLPSIPLVAPCETL